MPRPHFWSEGSSMTLKKGVIAKERPIGPIRDLTREDLALLRKPRTNVSSPQKLRDSHHRIARLVATGLRLVEIQAQSGYSMTRLSQLMASPAFQELVAHYRKLVTAEFVESQDAYYELATTNMLKAERQLADRLDEADENNEMLPVRELIAISRDAADRFGYSKKETRVNLNLDFAAQLEKAIKRSGKTLEAVPVQRSTSPPGVAHMPAPAQSRQSPMSESAPQPLRRRA